MAGLFAIGLLFGLHGFDQPDARPNIVIVYVDDLGYSDLGCFGGQGQTPNTDRLAREGFSFSHFYVNAPICSPSRAALLTGQYPQRLSITSYLDNRRMNRERGMAQWLDPKTPTLSRALQEAGYLTGHFGKWHLGGQRDVGDAPAIIDYGFDTTLTNFEGLGPRVLPLGRLGDDRPPIPHALGSDRLGRGPILWEDRHRITAAFVDRALAFIDRAEGEGKPFYLNLWPDDVHSPFYPIPRPNTKVKRDLYLAVLEAMDRQLGVLFDRIRSDEDLSRRTLILLASDNGPEPEAGSAAPFRGHKGNLYEGGIRSPLIVWGPGILGADRQGTRNIVSVLAAIDLAPTLLELAGVEPSRMPGTDGIAQKEVLLGRSTTPRPRPLFWRRPPDRPGPADQPWPDLAVRDGTWKLLCRYDGTSPQLYDLTKDPRESRNLSDEHPDVVSRLARAVVAWNESMPADAGSRRPMAESRTR